jgi:hypothetical protein
MSTSPNLLSLLRHCGASGRLGIAYDDLVLGRCPLSLLAVTSVISAKGATGHLSALLISDNRSPGRAAHQLGSLAAALEKW